MSTSSGFHTHSSWGRTRRPKTVSTVAKSSTPAGTLETTRVVAVSTAGNLAANLDSATEGRNGYATENQRFIHVLVKTNNAKSVTLYGYNYAFREWAPIFLPLGNATTAAATATTGGSGEAQMFVFEIAGIDRVAFVSSDAPGVVKAACSTF